MLTWNNPKTGASGAVALGPLKTGESRPGGDPVTCRTVLREYVLGYCFPKRSRYDLPGRLGMYDLS